MNPKPPKIPKPPNNPRQAFALILDHMKVLPDKKGQLATKLRELAEKAGWSMFPDEGRRTPPDSTLWSWMHVNHWSIADPLTDDQFMLLPFLEELCHKDRRLAPALEYFGLAKTHAPNWFQETDYKTSSKTGASQNSDSSQGDSFQLGDPQLVNILLNHKESELKQFQKRKDFGEEMKCLCALASFASELEDWNKAIHYRKAIVRLHEYNNDCLQRAACLTALAKDQYSAGLYVEAIQNLKSARSLLRDLKNPNQELLCETLDYIGICTRALSREKKEDNKAYPLSEALVSLNESLDIRLELKSTAGIASTLHRLGHLQTQVAYLKEKSGEEYHDAFLDAKRRLKEAMDLREKHGLRLDYCRSANQYVSLFVTFHDKSPPERLPETEIRRLLEETSRLAEESKWRKIWFQSLITLLRFERKVQNYQKAIGVIDAAFEPQNSACAPSPFERAKLYEQRAKIASDVRDLKESHWWEQAEELWRALGDDKRRYSAGERRAQAQRKKVTSRQISPANPNRTVVK